MEPLKAKGTGCTEDMAFPLRSVMVTMVLLKEAGYEI